MGNILKSRTSLSDDAELVSELASPPVLLATGAAVTMVLRAAEAAAAALLGLDNVLSGALLALSATEAEGTVEEVVFTTGEDLVAASVGASSS